MSETSRVEAINLYHAKKFAEAVPLFWTAIKQNPLDYGLQIDQAECLSQLGDCDFALELLSKIPHDVDVFDHANWTKFHVLIAAERYGDAQSALNLFDKFAGVYCGQSWVLGHEWEPDNFLRAKLELGLGNINSAIARAQDAYLVSIARNFHSYTQEVIDFLAKLGTRPQIDVVRIKSNNNKLFLILNLLNELKFPTDRQTLELLFGREFFPYRKKNLVWGGYSDKWRSTDRTSLISDIILSPTREASIVGKLECAIKLSSCCLTLELLSEHYPQGKYYPAYQDRREQSEELFHANWRMTFGLEEPPSSVASIVEMNLLR